jgi:hypothetical protein
MPDRKQFLGVTEPGDALVQLLESTRHKVVSEEELQEQRVSFAFGNSLNSVRITKESVRQTSRRIRLFPASHE